MGLCNITCNFTYSCLDPQPTNQSYEFQLVTGHKPDVLHLRMFGCVVYVPITPPQRTKMGLKDDSANVGYEFPTIIR